MQIIYSINVKSMRWHQFIVTRSPKMYNNHIMASLGSDELLNEEAISHNHVTL